MSNWQMFGGIIVALVSFLAGWVAATEKIRVEIFKTRLEVYRGICRKSAAVVMAALKCELAKEPVERSKARISQSEATLDLIEEILSGGALVSANVHKKITELREALDSEDSKTYWRSYFEVAQEIASDLGLKESFSMTESLMNPLKKFRTGKKS